MRRTPHEGGRSCRRLLVGAVSYKDEIDLPQLESILLLEYCALHGR